MSFIPSQDLDPFSAGGLGVDNLHAAFLGPQQGPSRTDPYEQRNSEKWNMPENYRGKNMYLRDTVEDLLFTADQTFWTERVMPWNPTDDIHLQWTNLEANAHVLDVTPHQSESYAVTQKRSIRQASLVRRGISAEFENDFLKTPLGRRSFLATLGQFARSIQETANLDIGRALLNSHHFKKQFQRQHGLIRDGDLKGYFERIRSRFALVQKTKNGLEKLDAEISKEMSAWGGKANGWIVPENISIYATLVRSEKTDYDKAGYRGPDRIAGDAGKKYQASAGTTGPLGSFESIRMINGSTVFEARSRYVENVGAMEQFSDSTQTGEYNTMCDENVNYEDYRSESRSIAIYNEDIDDFEQINLTMAIDNCGLFDKDSGDLIPLHFDRRRSNGSADDAKRDFLTYLDKDGKKMRTAKYLYHLDPMYLPVEKLMDAAVTIDNALKRDNLPHAFETAVTNVMSLTDFKTAVKVVTDGINSILSLSGEFSVERTSKDIAEYVFMGGRVPVQARIGGNVAVVSEIQEGMFSMLSEQVPASKKDEILALNQEDTPFLARIEAVKTKLLEYAEAKVRGIKLKNTDAVEKFVGASIEQYAQHIQTAGTGSSATGSSEVVGYMFPGQDLTGTEYQYVYKGSERKSTGNRTVDNNSYHRIRADMAHDAQLAQSAGRSQSRRARDTGAGMGFEGIGQLAYGDSRREVRSKLDEINDGMSETESRHLTAIWNGPGSTTQKNLATAFLLVPITRQSMHNLVRHNILLPINFLLFRPHMQYKMTTIIKLGLDGLAGKTYIGHTDLGIEGEIGTKTSKMHLTTYLRPVVDNPKNVYVQRNVASEKYEGGNGTDFYDKESYMNLDREALRESIICVAIPCVERKFPSPMDCSGRFYVEYNAGLQTKKDFEELHYSTAFRYNAIYGFYNNAKKQGRRLESFRSQGTLANRAMYPGMQWMYNTKSRQFDKVRVNKGCWGKNVYAGVAPIRNGSIDNEMEQKDYSRFAVL